MIAPTTRSRPSSQPLWLDVPSFSAFAQDVENALVDGIGLTYSQRLKLLKRADHFGIRRFDANLLIAMVQHRTASRTQATDPQPPKPNQWLPAVMIVAAVQGAVCLLAWAILRPLF